MAMIEGLHVRNYRVLKNIIMGRRSEIDDRKPLTPLTAVIGKNGTGKSTLLDAFGFLVDALAVGVEEACNLRDRGGFDRIIYPGINNDIYLSVTYRDKEEGLSMCYTIMIRKDKDGRPYSNFEHLQFNPPDDHFPAFILQVEGGKGLVVKGKSSKNKFKFDNVPFNLDDPRKLALSSLGLLKEYPFIVNLYNFLSRWHLNYFHPDSARSLPMAGALPHLNPHGDNLANVIQFMEQKYKKRFQSILNSIAKKIPGIDRIDTKRMDNGKLLLRFYDKGFNDPFYPQEMSDGTFKLLALMLLINDPDPPPLIGIEEPENYLYPKLLESLMVEFRKRATGRKKAPQIILTTHQPYLIDALSPEETWILEKGPDGFASIRRASDDPIVKSMVEEEIPLGSLWYSGYLDPRKP